MSGLTNHWARARNQQGAEALLAEQERDAQRNVGKYASSLATRRRLRARLHHWFGRSAG